MSQEIARLGLEGRRYGTNVFNTEEIESAVYSVNL